MTPETEQLYTGTVDKNDKAGGGQYNINGSKLHKLYRKIVNGVNKDYAPVISIHGRMGVGKSMTALEISRILHEEINLMKGGLNVPQALIYDVHEFLQRIKETERKVLMFDEAGVTLNSKQWWSDFNRSIDETLQTMRKKNHVTIFISPQYSDLDKAVRNFVNLKLVGTSKGEFQVESIQQDYGSEQGDRQVWNLNPSYKPSLPPESYRQAYREKEEQYKDDVLQRNIDKLKEKKQSDRNLGFS